jgi:hypothetical protein
MMVERGAGERREGDRNTKGIMERKKETIFPFIFDGSICL